jgi:hypothetical protein
MFLGERKKSTEVNQPPHKFIMAVRLQDSLGDLNALVSEGRTTSRIILPVYCIQSVALYQTVYSIFFVFKEENLP